MSVTVNGSPPSAPQIAEFQSVFEVAPEVHTHAISDVTNLQTSLDAKQAALVSGSNIRTVNGNTLLGSTDLVVAGTTNLTYTAATRVLASDTGTDATLPLVSSGDAGLAPASGGGTTNFLRADGSWAEPPGGAGISDGDKGDITVSSSGTVWNIDAGAVGNTEVAAGIDAVKLADGSVSNTEFQYLNGVTSAIQTQLDGKLDADIATDITATKATPVGADQIILLDSADTDTPKLATLTNVLAGTQPLDSDLTTIAGLTATTDNFIQAKSSAWASRTPAQVAADLNGTGLVATNLAYRHIPQNSQSTAYTLVAADSGGHILHPVGDDNARTFTIPANASVAYPIGTAITFVNRINTVTIAITSDTLILAGDGSTGSRTLAANGVATAIKITSTSWIISGTGLT